MAQRYATPQGAIPRESASAFVISADGGDARSLTEFVALAATLVGPFVARIKAGTYTESVTLPANCTLIGEGRVVIAGTLTLTSSALLSARLVNLEIAGVRTSAGGDLLTDTAARFFAQRGYRRIGRDDAPEAVQASVEWSVACDKTAVPMARES